MGTITSTADREAQSRYPRPRLLIYTAWFSGADGSSSAQASPDRERSASRRLGMALYDLLCRSVDARLSHPSGVSIRVAARADEVDLSAGDVVVILPVLGRASFADPARRGAVIDQLGRWLEAQGPGRVLPILTSAPWRAALTSLDLQGLRSPLGRGLRGLQPLLREIMLCVARLLAGRDQMGMRLFLSCSAPDREGGQRPAREILDWFEGDATSRAFFDLGAAGTGVGAAAALDSPRPSAMEAAAGLAASGGRPTSAPGGRGPAPQGSAPSSAAPPSGVLVAIRSDTYSDQAWCERELLDAKRRRIPLLVVERLRAGERRGNAYLGNSPSLRWPPRRGAEAVVTRAMVEGLKWLIFKSEGERVIELARLAPENTTLMARPPELLDLAFMDTELSGPLVILHPDPELSVHEREVLISARRDLRLITPTTAFRRNLGASAIRTPLTGWQVALSLSNSPDVDGASGIIQEHVWDATSFLARALIGAGAALAYGGDLRHEGFTRHLISLTNLVRSYNQSATQPVELLHSYLAAPLDPAEGEGLSFTAHHLGAEKSGAIAPLLPAPDRGLAELSPAEAALYFSDMRRVMEASIDARVILGGQAAPKAIRASTDGYTGRYPGVLEEAWRALEGGNPLYVVGGFGGAAGLVAELATAEPPALPPRLREATWEGRLRYGEVQAGLDGPERDAARALGLPPTLDDLSERVRALLGDHLNHGDDAAIRWNGLSVADNHLLFSSTDPLTLSSLVLKGLLTLRAAQTAGDLRVELVQGSVTTPSGVDLLAFPVLEDANLHGAGYALDRLTQGEVAQARARLGIPIPVRSRALDARYLMATSLGSSRQAHDGLEQQVRAACRQLGQVIIDQGFKSVGVVAFGGSLTAELGEVVRWMVSELKAVREGCVILWFESDPQRCQRLRAALEQAEGISLTVRDVQVDLDPAGPGLRRDTVVNAVVEGEELDVLFMPALPTGITTTHKAQLDQRTREELMGLAIDRIHRTRALNRSGHRVAEFLFKESAPHILDQMRGTRLTVVHNLGASVLPFEAISATGADGALLRPALDGGVIRRLIVPGRPMDAALRRPPKRGRLKVLMVAPQARDPNDPESRKDAEGVLRTLRALGAEHQILAGADATRSAVVAALSAGDVDLLHFRGHGFFDRDAGGRSGLHLAGGEDLSSSDVEGLKDPPRVVFFNACKGGRLTEPKLHLEAGQGLAGWLLGAGVQAFLGCFWIVDGHLATLFADDVYAALSGGETLGDAVLRGRAALVNAEVSDWANYVLYGDADFQLVRKM